MKIIKLEIENFGNINRLFFSSKGDPVIPVIGKNGAGKTNFMDALAFLFPHKTTKRGEHNGILTNGETNGKVKAETDIYILERKFTDKGIRQLQITRKDGRQVTDTPGKIIDDLLGRFGLNVGKLMTMEREKLSETFLEVFNLKEPFDELKKSEREAYDRRTLTFRERSKLGDPDPVEKVNRVSVVELTKELNAAITHNQRVDSLNYEAKQAVGAYQTQSDKVLRLQAELNTEIEKMKDLEKAAEEKQKAADSTEKKDTHEPQERIEHAGVINEAAQEYENYLLTKNQIKDLDEIYDAQTDEIEGYRQQIKDLFDSIKYPVKGMNYDPDRGLIYKGQERISKGQLIKIAFGLITSQNPELKVVLVPDASLLDKDNRDEIEKIARKNDFQVFLELVYTGGNSDGAIILEAGEVKEAKAV